MIYFRNILWIIYPTLFFAIFCAHRQSPGGGPDDKTAPAVKATTPVNGSLSVPTDIKIIITFSEWLLPASEKGVSLYPSTPLKVKVSGSRLEIKPLYRLRDSTTYHLVVTSTLKDLHNNPLKNPINLIFSTGPSLDSGKVSGCVVDPVRKYLQPNIALFRAPWQKGDSGFCGTPEYLSQTDSSGSFSLANIRTGEYYLIAYFDKNGDSRLQAGSEEVYTTVESTLVVGAKDKKALLYPSVFDTARQVIASVKTIDNRTITGFWRKPWDTLMYPHSPIFRLEKKEKHASKVIKTEYRLSSSPKIFFLKTREPLDSGSYRLDYKIRSVFDTADVADTLRLDGKAEPDTSAPTLIRTLPEKQADLRPEIRFIWSEPVLLKSILLMADSTGDSVLLKGDGSVSDTSRYFVNRLLLPGRTYRIVLLTSYGTDISGNYLRALDSTDTASVITITTVKTDSIAVSLSGGASCLERNPLRKWIFKSLSGDRNYICKDIENSFRFDSIPAAKGLIGTFIDLNGNDRPDVGTLVPFVAPEPFFMFEDTIEARARWDVEGVELLPCDPCDRKGRGAAASDSTSGRSMTDKK